MIVEVEGAKLLSSMPAWPLKEHNFGHDNPSTRPHSTEVDFCKKMRTSIFHCCKLCFPSTRMFLIQKSMFFCSFDVAETVQVELIKNYFQLNSLTDNYYCQWCSLRSFFISNLSQWYPKLSSHQYSLPCRVFFDACDGIFLNYGWNEAQLLQSRGAAGQNRISDVYVGVDVFGRSCFGGGGYNCDKVQCLYFDLFFSKV